VIRRSIIRNLNKKSTALFAVQDIAARIKALLLLEAQGIAAVFKILRLRLEWPKSLKDFIAKLINGSARRFLLTLK